MLSQKQHERKNLSTWALSILLMNKEIVGILESGNDFVSFTKPLQNVKQKSKTAPPRPDKMVWLSPRVLKGDAPPCSRNRSVFAESLRAKRVENGNADTV